MTATGTKPATSRIVELTSHQSDNRLHPDVSASAGESHEYV